MEITLKVDIGATVESYTCTPIALDSAMMSFLPASPKRLREIAHHVMPGADFSDITTASELLIIIASAT